MTVFSIRIHNSRILVRHSCNITAFNTTTAVSTEFQPLQLKVDSASKKGGGRKMGDEVKRLRVGKGGEEREEGIKASEGIVFL